jgi:predicted PurR-regulated permease PerM
MAERVRRWDAGAVIPGRWRRAAGPRPDRAGAPGDYIEIDPSELGRMFLVPDWLRNIGLMSWFMVGIAIFLVGAVWLASLTNVIVVPVLVAAIVAAVAAPVVRWLSAHGVPRALATALLMLALVALAVGIVLVIVLGISGQAGSIGSRLTEAQDHLTGWLKDLGLDPSKAEGARHSGASGVENAFDALMNGVMTGVEKLSSLAFFLAMTALSLFFLLKDGPQIRGWAEHHMGVPLSVARTITGRMLGSLRGYFQGVTIVAAFNAVVVTIGALILGVPLIGTIAAVTFFGAFIPYLGAWGAGAFSVLIALGGAGTDAAAGMIVVQLLANGILQQLVQPFAMGASLGIHPLAVLVVTIAAGALFGAVGLILAAPVVAAATRVSADLARARAEAEGEAGAPGAVPEGAPGG